MVLINSKELYNSNTQYLHHSVAVWSKDCKVLKKQISDFFSNLFFVDYNLSCFMNNIERFTHNIFVKVKSGRKEPLQEQKASFVFLTIN